jgi:hypothetical protein
MTEEEMDNIHDVRGLVEEFNDGRQQGVSVGGASSSSDCPDTLTGWGDYREALW